MISPFSAYNDGIMQNLPDSIIQPLLESRKDLVVQRDRAASVWSIKIKEIDDFLLSHGIAVNGMAATLPAFTISAGGGPDTLTGTIKEFGKNMIKSGYYVTTELLVKAMLDAGVEFPDEGASPNARVTRVISGTGLYKGHKTKGWSLKGEAPMTGRPSGASSATMSGQDEPGETA